MHTRGVLEGRLYKSTTLKSLSCASTNKANWSANIRGCKRCNGQLDPKPLTAKPRKAQTRGQSRQAFNEKSLLSRFVWLHSQQDIIFPNSLDSVYIIHISLLTTPLTLLPAPGLHHTQ